MPSSLQTQTQKRLNSPAKSEVEHGLQVSVYHRGELIVDACAGTMAGDDSALVESDTLFPVFSCSKAVTATIIHRLAETGILDYDTPIVQYWPEFAANEKSAITLRHVLTHAAGLWALPTTLDLKTAQDWDAACEQMTTLTPAHEPGANIQYHAITYGWIVGAVACKRTGLSFPELLKREICDPLGITDLYIGLPESEQGRVCTLYENVDAPDFVEVSGKQAEAIPASVRPLYRMMNRPEIRRASIPATSGITNTKTLAKHFAALLPGGVEGVELLPESRIRIATERPNYPNYHGEPPHWMLGYNTLEDWNLPHRPLTFGHAGYGGSISFADPNRQLAVAITKNHYNTCNHSSQILSLIKQHFPVK